jgi:hypothetical protein
MVTVYDGPSKSDAWEAFKLAKVLGTLVSYSPITDLDGTVVRYVVKAERPA